MIGMLPMLLGALILQDTVGLVTLCIPVGVKPGDTYQAVLRFELPAGVTPARLILTDDIHALSGPNSPGR